MRMRIAMAAIATLLSSQPSLASPIFYETTLLDESTNTWQYDYTVGNEIGAALDWFTLFFDPALYALETTIDPFFGEDIVDPLSYDGPGDWDVFAALPFTGFGGVAFPGFLDAFAIGASLLPGETLGGFSIQFQWLGAGVPGSQPFTLFGDDLPDDLTGYELLTQPLQATSVPAPSAAWLLALSLASLWGARRGRDGSVSSL